MKKYEVKGKFNNNIAQYEIQVLIYVYINLYNNLLWTLSFHDSINYPKILGFLNLMEANVKISTIIK